MTPTKATLAAAALFAAMLAVPARAQLVGNEGWSYSNGHAGRTFHAQGQLLRRQQSGGVTGGSGTTVINSSTTIGNINQISQILAEGANGYLNTHSTQTTSGNQSATAIGSHNSTGGETAMPGTAPQ